MKAYSQSCMSLSLLACSRMPRCSVHTANVLGVYERSCREVSARVTALRGPRPEAGKGPPRGKVRDQGAGRPTGEGAAEKAGLPSRRLRVRTPCLL